MADYLSISDSGRNYYQPPMFTCVELILILWFSMVRNQYISDSLPSILLRRLEDKFEIIFYFLFITYNKLIDMDSENLSKLYVRNMNYT